MRNLEQLRDLQQLHQENIIPFVKQKAIILGTLCKLLSTYVLTSLVDLDYAIA